MAPFAIRRTAYRRRSYSTVSSSRSRNGISIRRSCLSKHSLILILSRENDSSLSYFLSIYLDPDTDLDLNEDNNSNLREEVSDIDLDLETK